VAATHYEQDFSLADASGSEVDLRVAQIPSLSRVPDETDEVVYDCRCRRPTARRFGRVTDRPVAMDCGEAVGYLFRGENVHD
jgi:hypothetical protein